MIVKRSGGMIEFIPSPKEKREGVIRDHVIDLLANLDARVRQLEHRHGIPPDLADRFDEVMARIEHEEARVQRLNEELLEAGITHGD